MRRRRTVGTIGALVALVLTALAGIAGPVMAINPNPEIRPNTRYPVQARVKNDAGWSAWGPDCGVSTQPPPAVGVPSLSSSRSSNTVNWSWTQPSNGNYYQMTNGRYEGASRSTAAYNQGWGTTQCAQVRAAHTARLAGWGYWSGWSNQSCQTIPVPNSSSCYITSIGGDSLGLAVSGGIGTQVSIAGGAWLSAPRTFTGLASNTSYTFYARSTANGKVSGTVACSGRTIISTYGSELGTDGSVCGTYRDAGSVREGLVYSAIAGAQSRGAASISSAGPATGWKLQGVNGARVTCAFSKTFTADNSAGGTMFYVVGSYLFTSGTGGGV